MNACRTKERFFNKNRIKKFYYKIVGPRVKRILVYKKFANFSVLLLTISLSFFYFLLPVEWIKRLPSYLIFLIDFFMFLIIWHKLYQVLYDIKLLFFFNDKFEKKATFPVKKKLPTITFIIPSYEEPFCVAKMTFDSVVNSPYRGKKEIIVVDNSKEIMKDDFINWKAYVLDFNLIYPHEDVTAKFFHNEEKNTLKPGNLDMALKFIEEGELVVFLDVDSTLPATGNLLERSAADFEIDGKLAFIQFKIKATNSHFNSLTQSIAVNQDLLRLRMVSRGYGGYKIFEGHNGIWRKIVLDEIGSWIDYYRGDIIITEDILKSVHAYAKGYYGKPLNVETGEWVPSSLKALESMWMRWMYGNSQVFFKCFKKVYSKQTTLVEKFDISYHILHHLVTMLFFMFTFLLQLFVKGPATNIFILSISIIPQLIGALTSYFTVVNTSKLSFLSRIKFVYAGFFLVDSFVSFTQIKSNIKFMFRIPQGWKVTEKGVENNDINLIELIRNSVFHIAFAVLGIAICVVSWIINYDMTFPSLLYHLGLMFISVNVLLCVFIFGKQGRKSL